MFEKINDKLTLNLKIYIYKFKIYLDAFFNCLFFLIKFLILKFYLHLYINMFLI